LGSFPLLQDDLTVTNISRIKVAAERKACNCLLLKVMLTGCGDQSR
jgi:enolase